MCCCTDTKHKYLLCPIGPKHHSSNFYRVSNAKGVQHDLTSSKHNFLRESVIILGIKNLSSNRGQGEQSEHLGKLKLPSWLSWANEFLWLCLFQLRPASKFSNAGLLRETCCPLDCRSLSSWLIICATNVQRLFIILEIGWPTTKYWI